MIIVTEEKQKGPNTDGDVARFFGTVLYMHYFHLIVNAVFEPHTMGKETEASGG